MSRDRRGEHARPTKRTKRIQDALRREEEYLSRGGDPYARYPGQPAYDDGNASELAIQRRRGPSLRRILGLGLLLILVVSVVGAILLWQRVSAFNDSVSTSSAASSSLFGPLGGDERVNVVLFGYGGAEHVAGGNLADSIQIISIDPANDATTVIPIPRDLWVEGVPGMPDNGKINQAFAMGFASGGIEEASRFSAEVLEHVTGLEIHHWMAIDFAGFRDMVDAVGGVTVNNPRGFRYATTEQAFHSNRFTAGRFYQGDLHLDGAQALAYSRARYTNVPAESSDFARSVRQQRVLGALRAKMGEGGLGSIGPGLAMMDALNGRMKTDLSAIDLFLLSGHMTADRRVELREGVILEATTNTIGQYILVVIGRQGPADYQPLHDHLQLQLAQPVPTPIPSAGASAAP
jgi:LCP family protein required for cell wall assembly